MLITNQSAFWQSYSFLASLQLKRQTCSSPSALSFGALTVTVLEGQGEGVGGCGSAHSDKACFDFNEYLVYLILEVVQSNYLK